MTKDNGFFVSAKKSGEVLKRKTLFILKVVKFKRKL